MPADPRMPTLFGKEVYQSKPFSQKAAELPKGSVEWMLTTTAQHYPLFRRLQHGLMLGQLFENKPAGYAGPPVEFLYKVLAHKVCFLDLAIGGFAARTLKDYEEAYT